MFLSKRCGLYKQMEVQGISLLISASWKGVLIKGKVWGATQAVLIDLWQWCNKRMRTRESSVLAHTKHDMLFNMLFRSSTLGIPSGSSNSPVKPIESRQEGVRSLKMLPCELSSREILLREMHIKHYQQQLAYTKGLNILRPQRKRTKRTFILYNL